MGRLLQRSGNATSLPYAFLPGNHEVAAPCPWQPTLTNSKTASGLLAGFYQILCWAAYISGALPLGLAAPFLISSWSAGAS